jgi:uncharacterized membrane protein YcaP (DUF421 family)
LSIRELRALVRKQGVQDLHDVEEAVLESDGYVSIIKKSEARDELLLREEEEERRARR